MPDSHRTVKNRGAEKGQAHVPARAHTKHKAKGMGKRRPCLIEELCSESSESSNTSDATTARWHEASSTCSCITVNPSVREGQAARKQSLDRRDNDVQASTRCAQEEFIVALIPSVETWAVAASPGTQETLVMLKAGVVGREHGWVRSRVTRQRLVGAVKGDHNTDGQFDTDSDVCVTSQPCFPERGGWCSCTCKPSTGNTATASWPTAKAERQAETQAGDSNCMVRFMWRSSCGTFPALL